jgi:protein-tyrosine-phosphatase
MGERGMDISGHAARPVSAELINRASLLVALAGEHLDFMKALVPGAGEWMMLLGALDSDRDVPDVRDPIGGSIEDYREVRDDISHLVGLLIPYLAERFGLETGG